MDLVNLVIQGNNMKAKVIETGEIVNVLPYPTIYQEKGQGPDRREWYEDDLEFEPGPKRVSLDKVCEWIKDTFCETDDRFNQDFTGILINSLKEYIDK